MGTSAQQHRIITGLFCCLSLKPRRRRGPTPAGGELSHGETPPGFVLCVFLVLTYWSLSLVSEVGQGGENRTATSSTTTSPSPEVTLGQVQNLVGLLLLLAGDVELNPGPVSALELTEGLAKLVTAAPDGSVKDILLTWSPDKDVKADMNTKFKVPELKQALAWLLNCPVENARVKSIPRKAEILEHCLLHWRGCYQTAVVYAPTI